MSELSIRELEKIATSYEKLLVPALFDDCAEKIADIVKPKPGKRILDIACGTGILARTMAVQVGSRDEITGLDMNPGMLAVAEKLDPGLEWRQGNAEDLPFDDNSFDIVACQLSLMFFDNKEAAIQEMLRVMTPGGRLVVAVFDSIENIPVYRKLIEIYSDVGDVNIGEFLKMPFSLGDTTELKNLFSRSGLGPPFISTHEFTASWPDVRSLVLADVEGWFPLAGIELNEEEVDEVVNKTELAITDLIAEDGSVNFTMPVHFIKN